MRRRVGAGDLLNGSRCRICAPEQGMGPGMQRRTTDAKKRMRCMCRSRLGTGHGCGVGVRPTNQPKVYHAKMAHCVYTLKSFRLY
eukprot:55725-Eustigmatos_ZCMA.PRE.1